MCGLWGIWCGGPLYTEVKSDLGNLHVFYGIAVFGVDIGVSTQEVRHSFVVVLGHSELGGCVERLSLPSDLGVTSCSRMSVEAGTDDGLWGALFAYPLDSLFAPST